MSKKLLTLLLFLFFIVGCKQQQVYVSPLEKQNAFIDRVRHHLPNMSYLVDSELIASGKETCALIKEGFTYRQATTLRTEEQVGLTTQQILEYEMLFQFGVDAFCPQYN